MPGSINLLAEESSDCMDTNSDKITTTSNSNHHAATTSTGFYDAEKCRTYIANQIKVNKIDRFATQVDRASEIEFDIQRRLGNLMNMYRKHSAQLAHDFTNRCKLAVQRHRQDRILNHNHNLKAKHQHKLKQSTANSQQLTKKLKPSDPNANLNYTISNDLLYGPGAQLLHTLLIQSQHISPKQHNGKRRPSSIDRQEELEEIKDVLFDGAGNGIVSLNENDYQLSDHFDSKLYVKKLEIQIKTNIDKSRIIIQQLIKVRQLFERLALDHRDKVDRVYAVEEERQAATVTRRSTYNLSISAIKATSTPVHINNNNICSTPTKNNDTEGK